jgi:hypothetical protein
MSSRRSQRKWDAAHGRSYDPIGPAQSGNYPSTWVDESETVATDNPRDGKRDSATEAEMPPPASEEAKH